MGCGGSKQGSGTVLERPGANKIKIWGDYFSSDTRTLLAILETSGVQYDFQLISMLNEEHKQQSYLTINPSGQIPLVTEGTNKIIGGGNSHIQYICGAYK